MAEFLKGPIHETSGSPHVRILPGEEMRLQSAMAMPKQDVREIMMQGQRLFVPAVASIVAWDWGSDGRGRAALSWLVGRESANPTAKMGAFRLDLARVSTARSGCARSSWSLKRRRRLPPARSRPRAPRRGRRL
jgi:hypothetical protein